MLVSSDGGGWIVQFGGGGGSYWTEDDAIAAARVWVTWLPPGACSEIVVQGSDGVRHTRWTYGLDPFPVPRAWGRASEGWTDGRPADGHARRTAELARAPASLTRAAASREGA